MEEDYEEEFEDEDTEESDSVLFSIGEDGKASIYKPEDYVEMLKKDADIIREFIEENRELFDAFIKKRKEVKPNSSHQ